MKYWLLPDTHFGHGMLVKENLRPLGFETRIITNLIRLIKPGDVVIHFGDFAFYDIEKWHEIFFGTGLFGKEGTKAWLIRGNHDKKSNGYYLEHGWDFVADEIRMKIFGKMVAMTHCPLIDITGIDLNIHGHLHNVPHHPECITSEKHRLICMEDQYMPVDLRKVVERKKP